jgi:kynurenine formamidase
MLQGMRAVDLTIPLGPETIMWPGAPEPTFENLTSIQHDGYFARIVSFFEHTGTHFDAPSHFIEGHNTVDKFPAEQLVRPAVVIDISR